MQVNNLNDVGNALASQEIKSYPFPSTGATVDNAEVAVGAIGLSAGSAIGRVTYTTAGTIALNASNFQTITLTKRTAGGAPVTLATLSTAALSVAAWVPAAFTIVAGASVAPGDILSIANVHSGTGVAIPAGVVEIFPAVN